MEGYARGKDVLIELRMRGECKDVVWFFLRDAKETTISFNLFSDELLINSLIN